MSMEKIHKVTLEFTTKGFIAYKISKMREEKEMSQEFLAKKLDITRASLSNIEKGRQSLSLKLLEQICDVFQCKSSDILCF